MPDESISLEETNKIRISLGLKPLGGDKTDQTTKTVTKEEEAENNYAKKLEEEAKDREIKCVQLSFELSSMTNKNLFVYSTGGFGKE